MNPTRNAKQLQAQFLRQMALETQFHKVFDALPGLHFFAKNRAGQLLFVSRGILIHNHMTAEEQVVGKTDFELNPSPYAQRYVADDAVLYATGEPLLNRIELWFDRVGLPDWYVTNKFPILDARGAIIGIMGTLESCAERRQGLEPVLEIRPAIELIRHGLQQPPSIGELAASCGLSERTLQRKFQSTFGMSPQTYLLKTRIRAVCQRLRETSHALSSIAAELGFCDQSAFTRQFRQHVGTTPRKYRAETRSS